MEHHEHDYVQLSIFQLLPGSAGGRALRDLKGTDYFADLAKRAAAKRTQEERRALAKKAAQERKRRLFTLPRTKVTYGFLAPFRLTERIVPWFPHQKERQRNRKRPIFVRIELDVTELDDHNE